MEKTITKINLQTVPNGYTLTVNGEGFMYFNEVDLLAGFIAHVGMRKPLPMEKSTILSGLFSALLGDEYAQTVTTLKCRAEQLESAYERQQKELDTSIKAYKEAAEGIDAMKTDLKTLHEGVKAEAAEHCKTLTDVNAMRQWLTELEEKSREVSNTLANSAALLRAMEETAGKKPAKTETPNMKTKRGGRRKNDAAILGEIERQCKNNPNIK